MLHIGDNRTVSRKDIVMIIAEKDSTRNKSRIILTGGRELYSPIVSTTLLKRLQAGLPGEPSLGEPKHSVQNNT